MAKKTGAGGKKRKVAKKGPKTVSSAPAAKGPADGGRYNSGFMDHKNYDGKLKAQRIEKKRG